MQQPSALVFTDCCALMLTIVGLCAYCAIRCKGHHRPAEPPPPGNACGARFLLLVQSVCISFRTLLRCLWRCYRHRTTPMQSHKPKAKVDLLYSGCTLHRKLRNKSVAVESPMELLSIAISRLVDKNLVRVRTAASRSEIVALDPSNALQVFSLLR